MSEKSRTATPPRWLSVPSAGIACGMPVLGILVAVPGGVRIAVALALGFTLVAFALRSPRAALTALVLWFVVLGLARRLISELGAKDEFGDPLLLVGAGTWVVLAALALHRGALGGRNSLTRSVVLLMVLLGASALNPLQGGLTVGLSGALLVVVPMTAFFVGRAIVDDDLLHRLFVIVACCGVVVALYGLLQTFLGFPSWDARWIEQHGYVALTVGGVSRAFASFSAASEYASFLGIAVVIYVAYARGLRRASVGFLALAILAAALWFESGRGIIVLTVVAVVAVVTARAGLSLSRGLLLGGVVLIVLPLAVGRLLPSNFSGDPGGRLAQHQVEGLSDPFGEGSTLPVHIESVVGGLAIAIKEPFGVGVGAVTISGEKYGGIAFLTEADPSNMAVAAGIPGLVAYLCVVLVAVPRLYRRASRSRDALSLAALGIAVVTLFSWLNGGHYATAFWPWLILGWSDAIQPRRPENTTTSSAGLPDSVST